MVQSISPAQRRIQNLELQLALTNSRLRGARKENERLRRVALGIENIVRELTDELAFTNMIGV